MCSCRQDLAGYSVCSLLAQWSDILTQKLNFSKSCENLLVFQPVEIFLRVIPTECAQKVQQHFSFGTVLVPILRLEDFFDQGDYLSKLLTNAVADEVAERRKARQAVDLGLLSRAHGPLEPVDEGEEALMAELELQAK